MRVKFYEVVLLVKVKGTNIKILPGPCGVEQLRVFGVSTLLDLNLGSAI